MPAGVGTVSNVMLMGLSGARAPSIRRAQLVMAANRPRIGYVERQVRRELIAAGHALTTRQLAERIYRTTPLENWHLGNVRRSAPKFAVRVRRIRRRGLPILWAADTETEGLSRK